MDAVAIAARQRVYGLTDWEAGHQDAGTAVGRLWLRKAITRAQMDAADRYFEKHRAYDRARKAPIGLAAGNQAGHDGELVTDDYIDWAIGIVGEVETLIYALKDINAEATVHWVVILGNDPPEFMLPALREGLDCLAKRL